MRRRGFDNGRGATGTTAVRYARFPNIYDTFSMMAFVFGSLVQFTIVFQSFPDRLNYKILECKVSLYIKKSLFMKKTDINFRRVYARIIASDLFHCKRK